MADWFYVAAGEPTGPVDEIALKQLFENATLPRDTQVWHAGMPDWTPASEVTAFAKPPAPVYVIKPVIPASRSTPAERQPSPPAAVPAATVAPVHPTAPVSPAPPAPFTSPAPAAPAPAATPAPEPAKPITAPSPSPVAAPSATELPRLPLIVPRWIKVAGLVVGAALVYSSLTLPWHFVAAFNYVCGQQAETRKDFIQAAALYQASLAQCPHSPVVLGRLGVVSVYRDDNQTLSWVYDELAKSGPRTDSDILKAQAAIADAQKKEGR